MQERKRTKSFLSKLSTTLMMLAMVYLISACSPKVEIVTPDKPIEINLNIKIEQEIRVKIENDLDKLFDTEADLF